MATIRNPAKSRPLSANVRRLMKMEREAPKNESVMKIERPFSDVDIANCELQGEIFMAAIDRGLDMAGFAPLFMNSQIAGIIDYAFSRTGGAETDEITALLHIPLLMKSPEVFVDVLLWLDGVVNQTEGTAPLNLAVMAACSEDAATERGIEPPPAPVPDMERLAERYEYAYWLGYIYRYECLLHEESSRMVYGAFAEPFMRDMYAQMLPQAIEGGDVSLEREPTLAECAGEICRRLDLLLVGKLWKDK